MSDYLLLGGPIQGLSNLNEHASNLRPLAK